ncbi:hypothetical protein JM658_01605 [Joostella atrarenae]|uniref:DUF2721 domain-containing protein n=1 Tax=Joostella atrarenae TaxID=679257 RepID=A0ABS9IZA3_9FLAO|nr:hypothetical protein [Joostella atrarenae]MCF8713509.1 hypothetical protein [Joostella atrarenae]
MNWYIPITILPGLGMLILSTATQMMGLSSEIAGLISKKCNSFQHDIANRKIKQLGLLTRASTLLYTATGCYVLSGIMGAIYEVESIWSLPSLILYVGTVLMFIGISILIVYASRTVIIRRIQFDNNHLM